VTTVVPAGKGKQAPGESACMRARPLDLSLRHAAASCLATSYTVLLQLLISCPAAV